MMFLLDTNIVSELRRARPHGAVVEWMSGLAGDAMFLSAVTAGELQAGIEITREQDQQRAAEIEAWADMVMRTHNVLPLDGETFRIWARLMHRKPAALYEDALIAATALRHDLTVATRNLRDFEHFDARTFNPFGPT